MKTKEEYITELTEVIERTKLQIEVIDKLMPVMKSLDGTNIRQQKKIKTKLQEALPDFSISFGEKYSWYAIAVYKSGQQILGINCGYQNETDKFDYDVISGAKERQSGGMLGNNYYFGTGKKYPDCKTELIGLEKQLLNVDKDYAKYVELHEQIKAFNVPFLSIDTRH
jgi:hypothetical protein